MKVRFLAWGNRHKLDRKNDKSLLMENFINLKPFHEKTGEKVKYHYIRKEEKSILLFTPKNVLSMIFLPLL
jgi:hypothetical protein